MQPQPDERLGERDLETWDGPDLGSSSREGSKIDESTLGLTLPFSPPISSGDSQESEESDDSTPQPASEKSDEWDIAPPPMIAKGRDLFGKYRLLEKI